MSARAGTAFVEINADFSKLDRQLKQKFAHLGSGGRIDLDVGSSRGVDRLSASAGRARRETEGLNNSLLRAKLALGALAVIPAAQGLSSLAAGAVAATASLGPLAGTLAALPTLMGTAAQGIGTLKLATMGISDAIKAAGAASDASAQQAVTGLNQAAQAAEQARVAALALEDAHRQEKYATEALTAARADARRELEDLRAEAERSVTSTEGSALALRRAREELRRTSSDEESSGLDVEEAQHRVEVAYQDLDDTRAAARRARADYQKAEEKGVDKSAEVVAAERAKADAVRSRQEAERQAAQATKEIATATTGASSATSRLQVEMGKLSPEAREFAQTLVGLKPQLDRLRAAAGREMFPGFTAGITSARRNLPVVERLLGKTGDAFGDLGRDAGELVGSRGFGRDLELIGTRNVRWTRQFGEGMIDLADATRHLMVASGPFVDWLSDVGAGWAENTRAAAAHGRQTGSTARFLERTRAVLERLASISQSAAAGLLAVGRAGTPLGDDMWRAIDRVAQRFENWTESIQGQRALASWFESARRVGQGVADVLNDMIARFSQLKRDGRSSFDAIAIAGSEAFARVLSHAAEAFAKNSPAIAEAFVRGFWAANIWGKAFTAAFILSKLGGGGGFSGAGRGAGGAFSSGLAGGVRAGFGGSIGVKLADNFAERLATKGGILGKLGGKLLGQRGATPANPLFVKEIAGGLGGPGRGGRPAPIPPVVARGAAIGRLGMAGSLAGPAGLFALLGLSGAGAGLSPSGLLPRGARTPPSAQRSNIPGSAGNSPAELRAPGAKVQRDLKSIQDAFARLRASAGRSVKEINKDAAGAFSRIGRTMGAHTATGRRAVQTNFDLTVGAIKKGMASGKISTKDGMEAIKGALRRQSGLGQAALGKNFNAVESHIRKTMSKGGKLTAEGMDYMRQVMAAEMQALGLSKDSIRMSLNKKRSALIGFTQPGARGGFLTDIASGGRNYAGGGMVQFGSPGQKGQDTIAARFGGHNVRVAPGEVGTVFNRHQLPIINQRLADFGGLGGFFKTVDRPHFMARGGMVDPKWDLGSERLNASISSRVGQWAKRYGADMTAGYDPGGGHVSPGHNVTGTATDMVPAQGGPRGWDRLEQGLKALVARGIKVLYGSNGIGIPWPNHGRGNHGHIEWGDAAAMRGFSAATIPRVTVKGPDGGMKTMLQGLLDVGRRGARSRLNDLIGSTNEGPEHGAGAGAATRSQMVRWARTALKRTGHTPSRAAIEKILTLARKESGWIVNSMNNWDSNARAGNPSGGLMHVTRDKMNGASLFDPILNMMASIRYQFSEYGGLVTHSPYARGGPVTKGRLGRFAQVPRRALTKGIPLEGAPTWLDQLEANSALAALTPGLGDDILAATALRDYWSFQLDLAQRDRNPTRITEAASGLASAIESLKSLSGAGTEAENASQRAGILEQLLRESNLRTAVSERQFAVLKNMPAFGGQFAGGGVVPGPAGAPRTVIAHGGETITPQGGGGLRVIVEDRRTRLIDGDVEHIIDRKLKTVTRGARRPMPGRGGGGL